ncbi:MAG TPA: hypothetical protein VI977_00845 [archaeon]|nr:hypothetical protein [archaeon]
MRGISGLVSEGTGNKKGCSLCKEASIETGKKTGYGAVIIFRIGKKSNGWFATLSPKTGGNPEEDFTIQLMPFAHLTHFAQISKYHRLAENYGIAFAKLTNAMAQIMADELAGFRANPAERAFAVSIATYGKCTNWAEKKEHLHLKIFPFRGNIGQPYTVDSSFAKKKIFRDAETGESFVKMNPVAKVGLPKKRLEHLSKKLIEILGEGKND